MLLINISTYNYYPTDRRSSLTLKKKNNNNNNLVCYIIRIVPSRYIGYNIILYDDGFIFCTVFKVLNIYMVYIYIYNARYNDVYYYRSSPDNTTSYTHTHTHSQIHNKIL